jgi:hypothetical protein
MNQRTERDFTADMELLAEMREWQRLAGRIQRDIDEINRKIAYGSPVEDIPGLRARRDGKQEILDLVKRGAARAKETGANAPDVNIV